MFDYGRVSDVSARELVEPAGPRSIASTGVGIRIGLSTNVLADLQLAKPLTRAPAEFTGGGRPLRGYFSLIAMF